jgi:protein-tyrosine phosphatase
VGGAARHGIRTIVDLRNDDERDPTPGPPPQGGIEVVRVPLDDLDDTEFWRRIWDEGLDGTPLYYRPFLEAKAGRCVAAVASVADVRAGGVLVHCAVGRDRAGLVALSLLALVGLAPADIADDYELSNQRWSRCGAGQGRTGSGRDRPRPWLGGAPPPGR